MCFDVCFFIQKENVTLTFVGIYYLYVIHFVLQGLKNENDIEGYDLGTFRYEQDGDPIQYFKVKASPFFFNFIEEAVKITKPIVIL